MRYSIGQFAGLHQVSKKTLRYYKDIGLLAPAGIDPANGYAYYEDEQSERMRRLQYLRRLRFSLEEVRTLLNAKPEAWADPIGLQLAAVRSEKRLLEGIEQELLALQGRIGGGEEPFKPARPSAEYAADLFELREPRFIVGRAVRVPYNRYEEKQRLIDELIGRFFGDGEPSLIPNRRVPAVGFGLVCECEEDMSLGTYLIGVQVTSLDEIPDGMRSFTLPAGRYARTVFQASDRETLTSSALEGAYDFLHNQWLPQAGHPLTERLTAEVYADDRMEDPFHPEMELWQLLRRD
ncbi:MerR family transcriptional regulator [Gorillibacterium sp. sgz500922]|uniref:MerR family transcriptional regulator n=1 Tax=Gorillibacterium sp. sgz500922 TaxID=3446694 RepID=UPI003F66E566